MIVMLLSLTVGQTISIYPPSIGSQRGEQNVVISCNITGLLANTYAVWVYYPTWQSNGYQIFSTYNNLTNDPNNFAVSPLTVFGDTLSIDLVIKTVKPELATQYHCGISQPHGRPGKNSSLIALDPVECPSGVIEYDEGNEANLSCSVNYYESLSTMVPMFMWYRDGQPVPGVVTIIESPTRKTARLTKNVTSADDDQKLVCIVDFANSNPSYTDNCSTVVYVRLAEEEPTVQDFGLEAWVIAVAVIVPIVIIAIIAIVVFFVIRHRDKKTNRREEDSDRSRTNIDSSNTPQLYEPVLSAQNLNSVPTYAQLTTSTNVDVIGQSLSDTASYDYPGYQLNANESSLT